MSLTRCPKCSNIVPQENRFCAECGTPRPSAGWVSSELALGKQFSDTDQAGKSESLSPEERQRIYEEEKARIEARRQLEGSVPPPSPPPKKGHPFLVGCVVIVGALVVLSIIGSLSHQSSTTTYPSGSSSGSYTSSGGYSAASTTTLKVVVTRDEIVSYGGFVKIEGTVQNLGPNDVYSPSIIGEVFGRDRTLLGQDREWPAGQFLHTMAVGQSAAFSMLISLHGAKEEGITANIRTETKGAVLDVRWPNR